MKEILENGEIMPLVGGDSGETFLIVYKGKKFVLRKCSSEERANELSVICNKLKKYAVLPKLFYQEKKNLIFEYIDGRDCKKTDALKVAEQIGKICALTNGVPNKNSFNLNKRIEGYFKTLAGSELFTRGEISKIKLVYSSLNDKINLKVVLDANDVYPENFRLRKGKVYLVDVDAIKPLAKGFGIGKAFVRWFRTPKQQENFKKGYNKVSPISFLDENYLKLITLIFLVRNISNRIRMKNKINILDVKRLKECANRRTPNCRIKGQK